MIRLSKHKYLQEKNYVLVYKQKPLDFVMAW